MDQIGIYIHIPFCIRKCNYCDFLSFSGREEQYFAYIDKLCKQIDAADDNRLVASIYFGGGTPSILEPSYIDKILCQLKNKFSISDQAEITLEMNPGTASYEKLLAYRNMGINRLSIGLQSADDSELKLLGRVHNLQDFLYAYEQAARAGFDNMNVDVMTALPTQTKDSLAKTLKLIMELKPEPKHISAYSLILEEGTPFYDAYHLHPEELPSESSERELYYFTRELLSANGYEQYEISNFARKGYESRHNSSYWTGQDYYGFGLGASSLVDRKRIRNTTDLELYLEDPFAIEECTEQTEEDQMEEFMFLGLRMMQGVDFMEFQSRFGRNVRELYGDVIDKLLREGVVEPTEQGIRLTALGVDYGNYVFSSFLL